MRAERSKVKKNDPPHYDWVGVECVRVSCDHQVGESYCCMQLARGFLSRIVKLGQNFSRISEATISPIWMCAFWGRTEVTGGQNPEANAKVAAFSLWQNVYPTPLSATHFICYLSIWLNRPKQTISTSGPEVWLDIYRMVTSVFGWRMISFVCCQELVSYGRQNSLSLLN